MALTILASLRYGSTPWRDYKYNMSAWNAKEEEEINMDSSVKEELR